jgi:endonuclease III
MALKRAANPEKGGSDILVGEGIALIDIISNMREGKTIIAGNTPLTGRIWYRSARRRAQVVRRVCEALENRYGRPLHGNFPDPLDEVIYIILSNRTAIEVAQKCFAEIKAQFPCWDDILKARLAKFKKILGPAGLSLVKSRQIRAALAKIKSDFGSCDLIALRDWDSENAEKYLVSLPGVSTKVARCVMMYSLGAEVLAVDAHVHRIAGRLGWIDRKRADQCHKELDSLVPPGRRYAFHVDCLAHGREICRPQNPQCSQCCLMKHCPYAQARNSKE